jgi:hypothetical protein
MELILGPMEAFDVLGDPVRLRMLELLASGERATLPARSRQSSA